MIDKQAKADRNRDDRSESEIQAHAKWVTEEIFRVARQVSVAEEMQRPLEELKDFNTFDELVRMLRRASSQQRTPLNRDVVTMAADLLEKISKEGYRPPRPSARNRRDIRRHVQFHWALNKGFMTVEEFKAHMQDDFGIPEGTVPKIIYATENPLLRAHLRVRERLRALDAARRCDDCKLASLK